jgi:5-methylcytosine-specific restriction endonuclease McrA
MKPIYKISYKALYKAYKVEKKSIIECSRLFGCTESPIQRLLRKYHISYNKKSEMMIGKNNPMFGRFLEKHHNWKGGIRTYRRMKLSEVPLSCSDCGKKDCNLEVHHIDLNRLNNKLKNLRVLCVSCHRKLHHRIKK